MSLPPLDDRRVSPWWLRGIVLIALGLVLGVVAWWPMLQLYPQTPELDGRYVLQQFEIGKATVARYRELPLWNPFDCRGIPMWDHPEGMTASPILLALTFVDAEKTLIAWNLIHMVVGFVGMWLLARDELKLSREASFVASCAWTFGMNHTAQYAGAHSTFVTFWWVPLLLLLWRRAEENVNAAIGTGIVLALMIYGGGTYPVPFCVLFLAIETLTRVWPPKRLIKIARAVGIVGVVSFGLSASRLLPLLDQFKNNARTAIEPEYDQLWRFVTLKSMFTWRIWSWSERVPGQQYVWGEYNAYIGWLLLGLAVVGLIVALLEARWTVFVGLAVFALMLGHFHERRAPWAFLHNHVPPFKSMRVPSRFRHIFMAFIAMWIALAVDKVPALVHRLWRRVTAGSSPSEFAPTVSGLRVVLLGFALVGVGEMIGLGMDDVASRFQGAPLKLVTVSPRFYYDGDGLTPDWVDQPRQNRAWSGCRSYEWPSHKDAPIWFGDVPQAHTTDANAAKIFAVSRTVNTFVIDLEASHETRILLNSGYADGWRSNAGTVVMNPDGLLAVDVPAGKHRMRVRYWPKHLTEGFWISGLTLLGVVLAFCRAPLFRLAQRLRRRRSAPAA